LDALGPLAAIIHGRPWGIGVTSLCLLTSDVPVQLINAQDHDDQINAVGFWDVYVPLDPHRFLYLPGYLHKQSRALMVDHRICLPGGLAIPLNDLVVETAHRHIFWHPSHDPQDMWNAMAGLASRRSRKDDRESQNVLQYTALPPGYGIERRWLENHVWDKSELSQRQAPAPGPSSVREAVEVMAGRLGEAQEVYGNLPR
jgi:hypothetical protein